MSNKGKSNVFSTSLAVEKKKNIEQKKNKIFKNQS